VQTPSSRSQAECPWLILDSVPPPRSELEAIAERKAMRALIRGYREDARGALSELDATAGRRVAWPEPGRGRPVRSLRRKARSAAASMAELTPRVRRMLGALVVHHRAVNSTLRLASAACARILSSPKSSRAHQAARGQ
jgi:hypothetical protein